MYTARICERGIFFMKILGSFVILCISLCFVTVAYASEDTDEYPFPENFSFDDLPDIPLNDGISDASPNLIPAEENPSNIQLNKKTSNTEPNLLPETRYLPASGEVFGNSKTVSVDNMVLTPSQEASANDVFDKDKSLTETLKDDAKNKSPIEGTWVEKLTSSNPLSLLTSNKQEQEKNEESQLEEMLKGARNKDETGKSNASVFDIAGVMLRMNLQQTERTLQNRGFKKVNAKFQIPNFIKWRYEETCRNEGVVGYERLEACVVNKAKKAGYQYVQFLEYTKFDSKEEIEVYLTSNFTENKVYKIIYRSRIASITGNSPKAIYIRNIKIYDFWKKINQKYGKPDNKTTVTWGMGGNKPYLKAASGFLILEDPMFREMDYTRMSREDKRFINSDFYNF